jgi:hypothetical protein
MLAFRYMGNNPFWGAQLFILPSLSLSQVYKSDNIKSQDEELQNSAKNEGLEEHKQPFCEMHMEKMKLEQIKKS